MGSLIMLLMNVYDHHRLLTWPSGVELCGLLIVCFGQLSGCARSDMLGDVERAPYANYDYS
jgi:hypothetical protein